jgi:hypothetical protein
MDSDTTSIHGSYLGTVVQGGVTDELAIWNWKTGVREWTMPLDKGIGQWCFLDDAHILFPKNVFVGSPALRARQRRLHVRRFRSSCAQEEKGAPEETERIYVLPDPRSPLGSSMGARLLSHPTPDPSASHSAFAAGELFHPSAEDHLLTVELWAYYASGWEVTDLHIPTRVLLSEFTSIADDEDASSAQEARIVPWDAWSNAITQSPPLEHPRDMAPLGPLAHGMRRLCWNCGSSNARTERIRAAPAQNSDSSSPLRIDNSKAVSVWDLHRGRTEQALSALQGCGSGSDGSGDGPAAIQLACPCGGGGGGDSTDSSHSTAVAPQKGTERPYLHSEVPLPQEIQEADPIGIKFAMCGDALVVLEVSKLMLQYFFHDLP